MPITLILLLPVSSAFAQETLSKEEKEVFAVVEELFDAYRVGDSSRVRATFADNAIMMRATYKDGKSVNTRNPIDAFVNYVGGGLEKLHDELLWDYSVKIDDNLANIWTRYAFFLDGEFHHCGSETFTLYKGEDGWKIMFLADNSMVEECDIPEKIMKMGSKD